MDNDLMAFGVRAAKADDIPSCGDGRERPGYRVCGFVTSFLETPVGPVPVVSTDLGWRDYGGGFSARWNLGRSHYSIAPGLYAVGAPDAVAPVLVTANYKMSFDALREALIGCDAWLLVVDTTGINVWCAAGKGVFSAAQVGALVVKTGLKALVSHRHVILPQLSASGVRARDVKKICGFTALFGPIRASDVPAFIQGGMRADTAMRRVTFTFKERLRLTPVELSLTGKPLLWALPVLFLLSGIGPGIFSLSQAVTRGGVAWVALLTGVLSGAFITPVLLPLLPGRAFSVKGGLAGLVCGLGLCVFYGGRFDLRILAALLLWLVAVSSWLAMNFTGATPYTSPTGVEYEMKRAIPLQIGAVVLGMIIWLAAPFTG